MDPALFLKCARCGQSQAASALAIEGGRLRVTCTRCGHVTEQALASPERGAGEGLPRGDAASGGAQTVAAGGGDPVAGATSATGAVAGHRTPPVSGPRATGSTGAGLRVVHGGGASRAVPAPPPGHVLELPTVPAGHCPACLSERAPAAESCARCGLDFLRADPARLAPSDRLARDWHRLRQDWESPAAHHLYLERASATGELSAAGRLYRLHLLHHPADVQAAMALDGMMQRALAAGLPRRSRADGDEAERRRRLNRMLQAILVLTLLGVGLMVWMVR